VKTIKLIFTLFFSVFHVSNALSQNREFMFDLDYAVFKNDNKPLVEIYYSFYLSSLTGGLTANSNEAAGLIELKLYDSLKAETIFDRQYKVPVKIEKPETNKSKKMTGQINLSLNYGLYKLTVNAFDFYDRNKYTQRVELIDLLQGEQEDKPEISNIQLCEVIEKSLSDNSPFYKNGLEVFPNPSRLFSAKANKLYYYFEIYGMNKISSGIYTLVFNVYSSDNRIYTFQKDYNVKSESKAEFGAIEITDYPSGKYKLEILMMEGVNKLASSEGYFWVFSEHIVNPEGTDKPEFTSSIYFNMNENDVNDEISKIEYLLSDNIREKIKKLNKLGERRYFLFEFWKLSDPTPETPVNEFRNEYFERINYANKNFGYENIPGWKTDRGRIYCLYGRPDEIERYEFESKTRPHEIWKYNLIQNGVIFVFGDLGVGGSNYQLIHSTARGEVYDENWIRRVFE